MADATASKGIPVWGWVTIAAVVIAGLVVGVVMWNKKKAADALAAQNLAQQQQAANPYFADSPALTPATPGYAPLGLGTPTTTPGGFFPTAPVVPPGYYATGPATGTTAPPLGVGTPTTTTPATTATAGPGPGPASGGGPGGVATGPGASSSGLSSGSAGAAGGPATGGGPSGTTTGPAGGGLGGGPASGGGVTSSIAALHARTAAGIAGSTAATGGRTTTTFRVGP